uniref:Uncharacterized protein n=1 Tax=Oryza punctata TaxID=4537 RepID=A0A0E0KEN0_ORYPU
MTSFSFAASRRPHPSSHGFAAHILPGHGSARHTLPRGPRSESPPDPQLRPLSPPPHTRETNGEERDLGEVGEMRRETEEATRLPSPSTSLSCAVSVTTSRRHPRHRRLALSPSLPHAPGEG